jgi:hypothetical protein
MLPKRSLFGALLCALAALVLLPALASATVYCVNSSDPSCQTPAATIAAGLLAAETHAGADTVLVGPGNYTLPDKPNAAEVSYNNTNVGNTIDLRGAGDATHLTMGGTVEDETGVYLVAPEGSMVERMSLTIPANVDIPADHAFAIGGGAVGRELSVNGPASSNVQGIELFSHAALERSTVDLPVDASPSNTAIVATSGDATVRDSFLRADTGLNTSGNVFTLERSTIDARTGSHTDGGTLNVRDSLIELGSRSFAVGINLANDNMGALTLTAEIEGSTIVGGGEESVGVRVQANDNKETALGTISSTVISGPQTPVQVRADNERTAIVKASYSNFDQSAVAVIPNMDGSGKEGIAHYEPSEITNLAPDFADPASGNFHLAAGSALIDRGDPVAPVAGETDIDGQARAMSAGVCPPVPVRRDIGADEFVPGGGAGECSSPTRPNTSVRARHRFVTAKKRVKVRLRLSATEAGSTFLCKVDRGKLHACKASFPVWLKLGRHTITVTAVDAAGNTDPSPAVFKVRVVAKPKPKHLHHSP